VFGKNYSWGLCAVKNIYIKCLVIVTSQKCFLLGNTLKYIFYFLKIIFDISASKWYENIKKNNLK